jgi:predicted nucleic acid-binding protein
MGGAPLTNAEAWAVYAEFFSDSRVRTFPELPPVDTLLPSFSRLPQAAPKFWVDAYPAAYASSNQAVLISFDRAFTRYPTECRILDA